MKHKTFASWLEAREYLEECPCGSGKEARLERDARGIPLGYMCEKCIREKKKGYRKDVLEDPGYEADEPIEPEDY